MSKNISIDKIFKDGLSDGKEQLNLGAWANMERMLDGKNPYPISESTEDKKRKIFPLLLFVVAFTAITSVGAYFLINTPKTPSLNEMLAEKSATQTNRLISNSRELARKESSPSLLNSQTRDDENQNLKTNTNLQTNKSISTHKHQEFKTKSDNPIVVAENNIESKAQTHSQIIDRALKQKKRSIGASNTTKTILLDKNKEKNDDENLMGDNDENIELKTIAHKQTKKETINRIFAKEIIQKNRVGDVNSIQWDTIAKVQTEREKSILIDEFITKPTFEEENYQYHPRYVVGGKKIDEQKPTALNDLAFQASAEFTANSYSPTLKRNPESPNKIDKKQTAWATFSTFLGLAATTVAESSYNFLKFFGNLDPGISIGVNAALFKTKHQYGGFHLGITNRTEISNLFSVITELKYFIRNNAGFTINDIQTKITKDQPDTLSMPGSTIYSYYMDSTTKRYNFSNFMSMELPILFNAHITRAISLYAGPNFVYNFKLNVNEINTKIVYYKQELQPNYQPYNYPESKIFQYNKDDFKSRFGVGYAVGASLNFHPKIYLDLRLSKQLWDNTKFNSEKSISNGVTKVPFIQLSLGYKFLNKNK